MCGIAGMLNFEIANSVNAEVIKRMVDIIKHRGPDDEGFYIQNNIGMGVRRLSIIDIEGGHQPIHNEDETVWIVYNGEIYNYRELRFSLEKEGHKFYSNTDTEVIVHQYEEDGEDCVKKFNGMFAFAIWDVKKQKLFLARDRLGIKPLYYTVDKNMLIFGSEIKSILQVPEVERKVDVQALYDYFTFRYVPAPRSMFAGIKKLLPGCILTVYNGQANLKRYWDINCVPETEIMDDNGYIERFEFLLKNAVKKRLMSDVPLGVLLSGGLDSSSVTAMMSELGVNKTKTFFVAFDEGGIYSELDYARIVAKHFDTEHHEVVINPQKFVDFLPDFVWYMDEPVADLASVPLYYVARLASKGVKVVLSGEGSDEILAGYPGFENIIRTTNVIRRYQKLPGWIRSIVGSVSRGFPRQISEKVKTANTPVEFYGRVKLYNMTNIFSDAEKKKFFSMRCDTMEDSMDIIRTLYGDANTKEPLNQVLYVYSKSWLPDDLLIKADKMTMANSIELRVPFLDHELVEFAFSLPDNMKVRKDRNGQYIRKYMLYRIMQERLPQEILRRKKLGFPVPAYRWLENELKDFSHDSLLSNRCLILEYFKRKQIEDLLIQAENGNVKNQHKVWLLIVLEFWLNAHRTDTY